LAGVSSAYFINLFLWFWIRKIVCFFVSHRPPVTNIIHYNIPPQNIPFKIIKPDNMPNIIVIGTIAFQKVLTICVSSPESNLVTFHVVIAWFV